MLSKMQMLSIVLLYRITHLSYGHHRPDIYDQSTQFHCATTILSDFVYAVM